VWWHRIKIRYVGKKIPKSLVKIQGKEILWYIFNILKNNGFNHIILPLGYKGSMIKNFCKLHSKLFNLVDIVETGKKTNIGKRIFRIKDKIKSNNFLLLNGDAIFDFKLDDLFKKHEKKCQDVTFVSGEITYPYGTIGVINNKVKDFNRNLVYESIKVRNKKNYEGFNFTGMSIINTKKLLKFSNKFKNSENFEIDFYPLCIKRLKCSMIKLTGFWHSIDNLKDIQAVNNKLFIKNKYFALKKIKNKIHKIK